MMKITVSREGMDGFKNSSSDKPYDLVITTTKTLAYFTSLSKVL